MSTIAAVIAAEAREMLGICSEVRHSGIDRSACALHQSGEAGLASCFVWRFKDKPQTLFHVIAPDTVSPRRFSPGRVTSAPK